MVVLKTQKSPFEIKSNNKWKMSQIFVVFSEYLNFKYLPCGYPNHKRCYKKNYYDDGERGGCQGDQYCNN